MQTTELEILSHWLPNRNSRHEDETLHGKIYSPVIELKTTETKPNVQWTGIFLMVYGVGASDMLLLFYIELFSIK